MAADDARPWYPPESFGIETTRQDGHWAVAVTGEIDLSTARKLEAALERLRAPVVLDLSEVSFINSVGLVLLLRVTRNGVTIGEVSPAVTRLLRLNGFEDEVLRPPGDLTSGLT